MVASEPVIDRLNPRSTPISEQPTIKRAGWACATAVLATNPAGRPFIRFKAKASTVPDSAASRAGPCASDASTAATCAITRVRSSASTSTKSPATSGSTLHETPRINSMGYARARSQTTDHMWTGLAAHQPLGNINRARRESYRHSADFRAAFNRCPYHEPIAKS